MTAFIKIASSGVMNGVLFAPVKVGNDSNVAKKPTSEIVCLPGFKERIMSAIVLDDKQTSDKSGRQYAECQSYEIREA